MTPDDINCLIIGSNGFLGSSIVNAMNDTDMKFSELSHQYNEDSGLIFEIETPFIQNSSVFTHAIYLSWSTSRSAYFQKKSYLAAKYAADWAARNQVRIIFVSSMSASVSTPRSNYGRFKKFAEEYYLSLGFEIIRPGTVVSKDNLAGSALSHLEKLSKFGKMVLANIKPILLPITTIEAFTDSLFRKLMEPMSIQVEELIQETKELQSMLNLRSGPIAIKHFQRLFPLIPINIRDRLQTLIDLN
jgi:dTDP-4-dehydrorhamnose reductase